MRSVSSACDGVLFLIICCPVGSHLNLQAMSAMAEADGGVERIRALENEHAELTHSLLSLTTHFAQVCSNTMDAVYRILGICTPAG